MTEEKQSGNGNQPHQSTDRPTDTGNSCEEPNHAPPKPEPSYGIIDEGSFWPPLKRAEKAVSQ